MEAIDEAFSSALPDHRPTPPAAGPRRYRVGAALILIGASLVAPVIILAGPDWRARREFFHILTQYARRPGS
jgi:hypothetical protein